MNIINYENKEMTLQTEIERESYDNQKTTTFAKKNLKLLIIKVITELWISVIIQIKVWKEFEIKTYMNITICTFRAINYC